MVVAAEHFLVRPQPEAGEIEVGEGVAVADVEEEMCRALVVAVLEHLDQREAEHLLVELDGSFDIAADQSDVVHAAGGADRPIVLGDEILRGQFGATLRPVGCVGRNRCS